MMYESKLAAAIKVNGKVLREFNKDTVYIPFGAEYSILLKNLNTKQALVNIFVDGQNIVEGGLVLSAGQEIDLERFVKNGNLTEGNRLKFIERTAAIENGPRGIKLEDGLVRVEFQFECPPVYQPTVYNNSWGVPIYRKNLQATFNINGAIRGADFSSNGGDMQYRARSVIDQYCADNGIANTMASHDGLATTGWMNTPKLQTNNDAGITVPGSKSTQKFSTAYIGALESEKYSMVFKLLGQTADTLVSNPVTVKHKPTCTTCGKQNKATAKFCSECGTSLEIFA